MMKKIIVLLLALSLSLAFIGCNNSQSKVNSDNQAKTTDNTVINKTEPESEQPDTTSSDIESSITLIEPEIVNFLESNGIDTSLIIDEVKYMTISDYKESVFKNTLEDTNFDYFISVSFSTTVQKNTLKQLTLGGVDRPIFLYDAVGDKEVILFGRAFYTYKSTDKEITLIPEGSTKEVFNKINNWKDYLLQK
ncbi:hypothetical protein ACPWSR_05900 [Alloiococcus sp. CFN-8]|uniref:hypothetical protein n=1 Tax=Alloiococcus sp. CFN-8 TaxID=3416081 RepID=UPI003CED7268